MLNILLQFHPHYNCETFGNPRFDFLDDAMRISHKDREALLARKGRTVDYKIVPALAPLNANLILSTDADYRDIFTNALSSGEIIHLIIVDLVTLDERKERFLQALDEVAIHGTLPQNFRQIPLALIGKKEMPRLWADKIRRFKNRFSCHKLKLLAYEHFQPASCMQGNAPSLHADEGFGGLVNLLMEYRTRLLSDLQMQGLAVVFGEGKVTIDPVFKASSQCNAFFFGNYLKNAEEYIFLDKKVLAIKEKVEEFEALLDRLCSRSYLRSAGHKRTERLLHGFLIENPIFVYQNSYNRLWSEPRIYRPPDFTKYDVPDFVLKSTT